MNATATRTRTTTSPVWGSWKTHQNLSALVYFGQDRKTPATEGKPMVIGTQAGMLVGLDPTTGATVMRGGVATRFWAIPDLDAPVNSDLVPAEDDEQPDEAEMPPAQLTVPAPRLTEDAQAIVRAARPSRNAKLHACLCGCGSKIKGLYKQGHDARHAGDVARKAIAKLVADPDTNLADMSDLVAELPTEALRAKALKMVASRVR